MACGRYWEDGIKLIFYRKKYCMFTVWGASVAVTIRSVPCLYKLVNLTIMYPYLVFIHYSVGFLLVIALSV